MNSMRARPCSLRSPKEPDRFVRVALAQVERTVEHVVVGHAGSSWRHPIATDGRREARAGQCGGMTVDIAKRPRLSLPLVTITPRMWIRDQLELEARGVAAWLQANADAFPALPIVRVDATVATDDDGEWIIDLTVVLEDPSDPDSGWSDDALVQLSRAANDKAQAAEHRMLVYVFPQAVSTEAA